MVAVCAVCGPIPPQPSNTDEGVSKTPSGRQLSGLHFGAVTCLPCRQFFRRAANSRLLPSCRRRGLCAVDATAEPQAWAALGRHCPGCRLKKCFRVGMDLKKVLGEEEKKKRFPKTQKKSQEQKEMMSQPISPSSPSKSDQSQHVPASFSHSSAFPYMPSPLHFNQLYPPEGGRPHPAEEPAYVEARTCERVPVIQFARKPAEKNKEDDTDYKVSIGSMTGHNFTGSDEQMVKKYWYKKHLLRVEQNHGKANALEAFEDISDDVEESISDISQLKVDDINQLFKKETEGSDIQTFYNLYFTKEFNVLFMVQRKAAFLKTWYSINMGEYVIKSFIQFSESQGPLPLPWLEGVQRQFRERYLSSSFDMDIVRDVSPSSLVRILSKQLCFTNILPWVVCFSSPTAEEEIDFVLGKHDRKQWQERDRTIVGVKGESMLEMSSTNRAAFQEVRNMLLLHQGDIFKDMSVHVLMMLLVLFTANDCDKDVRKVHDVALSMLQRYLQRERRQPESDFKRVLSCVHDIPRIAAVFGKLNCAQ